MDGLRTRIPHCLATHECRLHPHLYLRLFGIPIHWRELLRAGRWLCYIFSWVKESRRRF